MQNVTFDGCLLSGIEWHKFEPRSRFSSLFASLKGSNLRYCTFCEMKLPRTDFSGVRIVESTFADCDLTESDFRGCTLDRTEFFRCGVEKADFRGATGYRVDVPTCRVKDARFSFPEAISLLSSLGVKID